MGKITLSAATLALGAFAAISATAGNASTDLSGFHGVVVRPPAPLPIHWPRPCSGPPILGVLALPLSSNGGGGIFNGQVNGVIVDPQPPGQVCPL